MFTFRIYMFIVGIRYAIFSLNTNLDLRVILLIRDPRAITSSRISIYSKDEYRNDKIHRFWA